MDLIKPNIFTFDNYRKFLREYVEYLTSQKNVSVRSLSLKAGFRSTNYLNLIIENKRGLTTAAAEKISRALELSEQESDFFINLVHFNQVKSASERKKYRDLLMKSRSYNNADPLKSKSVHYYSRWYYIAVRELVALNDFSEDPVWISMRLRGAITAQEAKEALADLIHLGLLQKDSSGRLRQVDKTISADNSFVQSALSDFHLNMIERSKEALETMTRNERDISAVTIPVNEESAAKIRMLMTELRREMLRLSEQTQNSDQVIQVNLQFFPLTIKANGGTNED